MRIPRDELAKVIPGRPRVSWWVGVLLALAFALLVVPTIMTERWLSAAGVGVVPNKPAPYTLRVPPFAGYEVDNGHIGGGAGGGVVVTRGEVPKGATADNVVEVEKVKPHGALPYLTSLLLVFVLAAIFTHHTRRSTSGRLLRVQVVSLGVIAMLALATKIVLLTTSISMLVVPVALLAMVPTIALDRVVGLATGVLAALIVSLLGPFDVGIAILLLVQAAVAGLVIAEKPKARWRAAVTTGLVATVCTAATYPLLLYFTTGHTPFHELRDPLRSMWLAAAIGPALATVLAVPLLPLYQLLVGEITAGKLIALEDLSHPLLRQIAEKAPGTWQHSLMMANMAEIAANEIGANGRLVRVGAYFHDLGKSLQPKYFIENLEPGEVSPHDQLAPEVSCDAIFAHVTEGIVTARKAGLHERIVDFMHMHHGNGILEYFWGRTQEQGNPKALSIEQFRYPGVPPQSRETAILAICDAVEAASRTLKKPDPKSIDNLVQRIVYGKLHLGQLDESGLSMGDLRRVSDSLKETIRHANHNRIEYPWQKAEQDASASTSASASDSRIMARLDSLDRPARVESVRGPDDSSSRHSIATDDTRQTPTRPQKPTRPRANIVEEDEEDLGIVETAPSASVREAARAMSAPAEGARPARTSASQRAAMPAMTAEPATSPSQRTTSSGEPATSPSGTQVGRAAPPSATQIGRAMTSTRDERSVVSAMPRVPEEAREPYSAPEISIEAELPPEAAAGNRAATVLPAATRRSPTAPPAMIVDTPPPRDEPVGRPTPPPPPGAPGYRTAAERAATPPTGVPSTMAGVRAPERSAAPSPRGREPSGPNPRHEPSGANVGPREPSGANPRPREPSAPRPTMSSAVPPPPEDAARGSGARSATTPSTARTTTQQAREPSTGRTTTQQGREPSTVRPAMTLQGREPSTVRPASGAEWAKSPPPPPQPEADTAITIPPPLRRARNSPAAARAQAVIVDEPSPEASARITAERLAAAVPDDDTDTQPSIRAEPRLKDRAQQLPLPAPPPSNPSVTLPQTPWAAGLAARIDAAIDDDFGGETPVIAPTRAELRALLGQPDPTRQASIEEIEALRAAAEEVPSEQEILRPRHPLTEEVLPEDIEAAIEVAPPARRGPNIIAVAKKKKPE